MVFQANWSSLVGHATPNWLKQAKFGIYTHWGIYCVPAYGPNATWYPYNMYRPGTQQYEYHVKTYGLPSEFGYKDFIPQFTAERFDPDEWAEYFYLSGAKFAGPVAEHHDGFAMWDTRYSEWNAARMGPKRDVVGLLEAAIRRKGMRFLCAFHHAENWWFYPHWVREYDTSDMRYAGLYGEPHNLGGPITQEGFFNQDPPSQAFLERWKGKIIEVIDRFQPDILWFDFGLRGVPEKYKQEILAYYFNQEARWAREVAVTFKDYDLVPGTGVVDLELGRMDHLTYHEWITDTTVDNGNGWGYLKETEYKSTQTLVHYLVDNVSKNGYLLLNIGPKPDGSLPGQAIDILKGMGAWLQINGEAIYGTTVWQRYGEGPTQLNKSGAFNEKEVPSFTGQDVRFTVKGDDLYAICLGWPGERFTIQALKDLRPAEIQSVRMLGNDQQLEWSLSPQGLRIQTPSQKPCEHAFAFKISRGHPFNASIT